MIITHLLKNMKYTTVAMSNRNKTAMTIAETSADDNSSCSAGRNMTQSPRYLHIRQRCAISCHTWESWRCCSPSTRSWTDASNEPPGKAKILQVYTPASRSSRWPMIKACSLIATLSLRNVSWILIPNCWWKTRTMISFRSFSLKPHWTWVIWSFSGPGMNLHGKETFCRRYPVTTAGDVILWAWKTAQKLRHQHHLQRIQSDEQFSKEDFAQSYKVL